MSSNYTQNIAEYLDDSIYKNEDRYENEGEYDFSDIYKYVTNEDEEKYFRSFGAGLLALIQKKHPDIEGKKPADYILDACEKNGVDKTDIPSKKTLQNWFNGKTAPDKGPKTRKEGRKNDRDVLFAIAFAMQFTVEETEDLFNKVYLDRAFDMRSAEECIYWFCLNKGKGWDAAKSLIKQIKFDNGKEDLTTHTSSLFEDIKQLNTEEELIEYINTHTNNFNKESLTAKETVKEYLEEARKYAEEEIKREEIKSSYLPSWGEEDEEKVSEGKTDKRKTNKGKLYSGKNPELYQTILYGCGPSEWEQSEIELLRNIRFIKEIETRFPEEDSFGDSDPTYEALRKMIILLFSYHFWINWQMGDVPQKSIEKEEAKKEKNATFKKRNFMRHNEEGTTMSSRIFTQYVDELNDTLHECGFSKLYYGNPYDCLFLYCSMWDMPLILFRGIMNTVKPSKRK